MIDKVVENKLTVTKHSKANEKYEEEDFDIVDGLSDDLDINCCTAENSQPKIEVDPNKNTHYGGELC